MTGVKGENSRLRTLLGYIENILLLKSEEMLKFSIRLVIHYLGYGSDALRTQSTRKPGERMIHTLIQQRPQSTPNPTLCWVEQRFSFGRRYLCNEISKMT